MSLDAQTRAYDLYALLEDMDGDMRASVMPEESMSEYCSLYIRKASVLETAYDESLLLNEVKARLASLERALTDARFEAAAAAGLHEFAKESFDTWQTAGIFMRKRVLKALRERAGFRLESHRIGNYVAKTFDLMNEAQARFGRAQQAVFAADVSYKVRPGIYKMLFLLMK